MSRNPSAPLFKRLLSWIARLLPPRARVGQQHHYARGAMPVVAARSIASYLLAASHRRGESLTNLKLQKLLYYAQGWYLGMYRRPLFSDPLEAWGHGPVCAPVYRQWSRFADRPIEHPVREPEIDPDVAEFLDAVLDKYRSDSAGDLRSATHTEEPWLSARGDLPLGAPSNEVITQSSMAEYFGALSFGNEQYQRHVKEEIERSIRSLESEGSIAGEDIDWDDILGPDQR